MPTTRDRLKVGWPSNSSREVLRVTLGMAEGGVAAVRRDAQRFLIRAELHLRAWREALDPDTHEWATEARRMVPAQTAEEIRAELQSRLERARQRP